MGIFRPNERVRARAVTLREFMRGGPAFVAAVTKTRFIGKDGGGLQFFAADAKGSDVFVHDPGAGQFAVIADSRAAFAEMDALVDRWDRYADPRGLEIEDLDAAETKGAVFREFRRRARALLPHVSLQTGSDYDETLEALAGKTSKLRARASAETTYKAMKWLMLLFIDREHRAERLEAGRALDSKMAKDELYALWHAFLYAPDATAALARAKKSSDALVRTTAQHMSRAAKSPSAIERLTRLEK